MGSFSGLGIGLSFVFGCIFLGLVAELYYLLWWKKRINNREIEDHFTNYAAEISYLFCWKKSNSTDSSRNDTQELAASVINSEVNGHENDLELGGNGKDGSMQFKGFGEESVESELMRLHNLCGPPRFLFTIKEETKEDLESDDGKSRGDRSRKGSRTRSLSDIIIAVDTPFRTPLPSPPLKTPSLDSYSNIHGFNPLFESITEAELNKLRSSPPPKFKFLRDAEEKLIRRLVEEAERMALKNGGCVRDSVIQPSPNGTVITEEVDGSYVALIGKDKERELQQQQQQPSLCHSTPSQVLPLASSPSTFRLADAKSGMQ
ncbi:uncharacterized protein LOC113763472 [Coffea eugenioides]|uniref:uncharacterized protein LOC113763472 n=1 Tax=Coffea eugenioides TaxID=49369 RepID=UPI000F611611|nr:uncharacterized protein LOC113763472 [Coffea eugenioides]